MRQSYEFKTPKKTGTIAVDDFANIDRTLRGIYVFRGKYGDCLYVGQTKSFRSRFMSHLATSMFNRHIFSADIYRVDNPYEREIFETVFIDELKPYYNRAKSFARNRAKYDDIHFEIESLEAERLSLEEEKAEILDAVDRPAQDSEWFFFDPYEEYTDFDEALSSILGEDLRYSERIPEINAEISRINDEIRRLNEKVS